jgi:fucokinase
VFPPPWDYLIVTASNSRQAEAYREQIALRESLGLIQGVNKILTIPDPGGRRIGSGGSTILCLLQILNLELKTKPGIRARTKAEVWAGIFRDLRILIVHAGGDSRRLPPYGPCGKIFVPLPGDSGGAAGTALFDRLIPTYLRLPRPSKGGGQVVVGSGDVLLDFDAASVVFEEDGITGVGALVPPELAANHGVYCREDQGGQVRRFLQKPSLQRQSNSGAISALGRVILDIGILNISPAAAVRLLRLCGVGGRNLKGRGLRWSGPIVESIESEGLDLYREVCCALGRDVRWEGYVEEVRESGSPLGARALRALYRGLSGTPFRVHVVPRFRFLHFGTLRELIESGRDLARPEGPNPANEACLVVNSRTRGGAVAGKDAWIEGCRVEAPLTLAGHNVVVGLDITSPLALPPGAALDVLEGRGRDGRKGWFVRVYSTEDVFHRPLDKGARLGRRPLPEWLGAVGALMGDAWPAGIPAGERYVWNGRFFPIVYDESGWRRWLWLMEPGQATSGQRDEWRSADRYSFEEMAVGADLGSFHLRRVAIRRELVLENMARSFGPESSLSAAEFAYLIRDAPAGERADWLAAIIRESAAGYRDAQLHKGLESLELSRLLHTAGSIILDMAGKKPGGSPEGALNPVFRAIREKTTAVDRNALKEMGAPLPRGARPDRWAEDMKEAAFRHLGGTIVRREGRTPLPPRNALRADEIVWGRAPARLDLGGGWTDTPPYSLERGGCVINAAVTLNGQAPIQAYGRAIPEREVRINSIDHSMRLRVRDLDELLDYRRPGSQFALAKAALALSGFSRTAALWPSGIRTLEAMLDRFGGGIELTTLAAIPSGSGLGTSSIMGAVLLSVIGRMAGRTLTARELFHVVLKLEQELTTGGGWQDQIGGAVEGVKMIESGRGLVPDPRIHFVAPDILDPVSNGGRTLLYYTGLRRLAKNILHEVVGRYLDRDRKTMETLRRLHAFPPLMAEAMSLKDDVTFGRLIDLAWKLNVDLDPGHTTPVIEGIRERISPHVHGAKLLGAGGGGFLFLACRSPRDAELARRMLEASPPNDRARFFDYAVSRSGLTVTVC